MVKPIYIGGRVKSRWFKLSEIGAKAVTRLGAEVFRASIARQFCQALERLDAGIKLTVNFPGGKAGNLWFRTA